MRAVPLVAATLLTSGCVAPSALAVPSSPCVPFGGIDANHQWLTGDHKAFPIIPEHQADMIHRVKRGGVEPLDRATAQVATGKDDLPNVSYLYLVRVGYVGVPGSVEHVDFGVDVDTEGVAYVSSFVLSQRPEQKAELAAVLTSPTPLKRVISSCGSAE